MFLYADALVQQWQLLKLNVAPKKKSKLLFYLHSSIYNNLLQESIPLTLSLQLGKPAVLLVIVKWIIVPKQRKLFSNMCMKVLKMGELYPQFGSSEFTDVTFQKERVVQSMFKRQDKLRKNDYRTHKQSCNILHFRNLFWFLIWPEN